MEQLLADLKKHDAEEAKAIIGSVLADVHLTTERR